MPMALRSSAPHVAVPPAAPICMRQPAPRWRRQAAGSTGGPPPGGAPDGAELSILAPQLLWRQAVAMAASGAALGPLLDGQHSAHDVLHYAHPTWQLAADAGPLHWSLETCWWVPLLFGVGGVLIGVGYPLLDELLSGDRRVHQQGGPGGGAAPAAPRWPVVLACIAAFAAQYGASGALEAPLLNVRVAGLPVLDVLLATSAIAIWAGFDRTPGGLAMSGLTALGGPAIEVALINGPHLYGYGHPGAWGIPLWIPWVYFGGGPAVGGLGRRVAAELRAQLRGAAGEGGVRE